MPFKMLWIFSLTLFILSIGFSFYFSQTIVGLNSHYQNFETEEQRLNQQIVNLQSDFLVLSQSSAPESINYVPINESIEK